VGLLGLLCLKDEGEKMRVRGGLLLGLAVLSPLGPATAQPASVPAGGGYQIDERLRTASGAFEVPGAAVVVVKNGEESFETFGVRRLGAPGSIGRDTVFPIGSTTKAFTATLIGMLVDEGKLKWDDKVRQHLPDLRLYDPYVTENITVRDLLAMRSGIANELIWLGSGMSRADVVQRLPLITPSAGFRERYVYSNINYLLAGLLVERLTDRPWASVIEERIFKPLGMKRSSATGEALRDERNSVSSHVTFRGRRQAVAHTDVSSMNAAGAINSTAEDMARWVAFQLSGLAPDGSRLISAASLREMQRPQMIMSGSNAYGFGWDITSTYRGKATRLLNHVGSTLGAMSIVALVPSEKLGVVILANAQEDAAANALLLHVLDQHLATAPVDHVAAALAERQVPKPSPVRASVPAPVPLATYAGVYEHPMMGSVTLKIERGNLMLRRGRWWGTLKHVGSDEFVVDWQEAFTGSFGGSPSLRFPDGQSGPPRRLTFWGYEFTRPGS
jgi:CubicO group peptidase (beta-lactamase class C family)